MYPLRHMKNIPIFIWRKGPCLKLSFLQHPFQTKRSECQTYRDPFRRVYRPNRGWKMVCCNFLTIFLLLDSRPKGCGFEPHRRHCVVSLSKNINPSLVLVQPRKTRPFITERLLMGRKESNQTNKQNNISESE